MHLRFGPKIVMAPEGDGNGGGGGGGSGDKGKGGEGAPDLAKENADLKTKLASFEERFAKLEGKGKGSDDDGDDLQKKAQKQRESDDKKANDHKALEAALKFNLKSGEFLKTNEALLPKDIADIFKAAEKENYANAIEKDAAIKAGIISSFFGVQANLDLLTPGLKATLEDYLKLTKTGKQEKAQQIYDSVFEPAFEMLRRTKKAEALGKGYGSSTSAEDAYKQKMMNLSKKQYLGEKSNGT